MDATPAHAGGGRVSAEREPRVPDTTVLPPETDGDVVGAILATVFVVLLAVGSVFLPVALHRVCRAVRRTDADRQPTTWFYVVVGYFLTRSVGAYYLYRRSQRESL